GKRRWEQLDAWPRPTGVQRRPLYLGPGDTLSWHSPSSGTDTVQSYVSDPLRPVPYQPRPVRRVTNDEGPRTWVTWLSGDQGFVDGRRDVVTYVTEALAEPVTVRGEVTAKLFAETTGSDADWVMKLIDVFPDLNASEPEMSGYQLMISGDILRG